MKKTITLLTAALLLSACGESTSTEDKTSQTKDTVQTADEANALPAKYVDAAIGNYSLEKSHAFLWFEVTHAKGISNYRVNFTDFDAKLMFDPTDLEASSAEVTINPLSLETNYNGDYKAGHANSSYESWNEDLARNPGFLNADAFPTISFKSTSLSKTDDYSGKMTGDLTFLGVTKAITMKVTYNGTGNKPWFGDRDLIGFTAKTKLKRSDFGNDTYAGILGDEVTVHFTGEFLQDEE